MGSHSLGSMGSGTCGTMGSGKSQWQGGLEWQACRDAGAVLSTSSSSNLPRPGTSSSSNLPRPCPGTSSSSSLPRPCPGCPGTSSSSSNLPRPAQHQQQQPVCGCARLAQQAVLRTGYNHVLLRAVCVHTHSHFNLGSAQQLQDRGIHSYLLCNYMDSNKTTKSSSSYREQQQQPTTAAATTSAAWLNRTLKVCGRVWSRSPHACLNDKPKLPDPSTHCRI